MGTTLMSLGNMPAGEGLGGVVSSALMIIGTLALIYGVLVLLDRYHKKHGGDKPAEPPSGSEPENKTFPQVLDEQIRKNEDKDGKA